MSPPITYVRVNSLLFSLFFLVFFVVECFVFGIKISAQEDKASSGDEDRK